MKRINEAFNEKAFIAYLMAGDPTLPLCAEYLLTAQDAGADLIEIGIPFSDPIAEGETIQAASIRALHSGAHLPAIFNMLTEIKEQIKVPLVIMTYLNPVFVFGYDRFFQACAKANVAGIIIPDMPFEEQVEIKERARPFGVEVISLIAPSSEARCINIAQNAEGFIYLVSSMGVTGMRSKINNELAPLVKRIRSATSIPVAIGFGISSPEQASSYAAIADGVIVGSAIVKIIEEHGAHAKEALFAYISEMKAALGT